MSILVTYATKHGATRGIAERIAEKLDSAGLLAVVLPTDAVDNVGAYAAVVVGSAVYYFHWMKDALRLLRSNRELLVERPVWLFSSGPLGTEETDPQGHDLRGAQARKRAADDETRRPGAGRPAAGDRGPGSSRFLRRHPAAQTQRIGRAADDAHAGRSRSLPRR